MKYRNKYMMKSDLIIGKVLTMVIRIVSFIHSTILNLRKRSFE